MNSGGQVGDGTVFDRTVPTAVSGSLEFELIDVGAPHTCALGTDGSAYCWGLNELGQLGDGTFTQRLEPTPVLGGHTYTSLVSGGLHNCAIETDGTAYCWGDNEDGQLGDGSGSRTAGAAGATDSSETVELWIRYSR
jgi:alpha-tubulin suppressor-like RCC1 family protein